MQECRSLGAATVTPAQCTNYHMQRKSAIALKYIGSREGHRRNVTRRATIAPDYGRMTRQLEFGEGPVTLTNNALLAYLGPRGPPVPSERHVL